MTLYYFNFSHFIFIQNIFSLFSLCAILNCQFSSANFCRILLYRSTDVCTQTSAAAAAAATDAGI